MARRRRRRSVRRSPRVVARRRNCRKAFRVKCGSKTYTCRIKKGGKLTCKGLKARKARRSRRSRRSRR